MIVKNGTITDNAADATAIVRIGTGTACYNPTHRDRSARLNSLADRILGEKTRDWD